MGLGDFGVPVAVGGGGGGAAADLFICSAVCVQEPERDRSSWEQKKPPGGAGGPSTPATGPDTRAEPPDQERLEGASLPPPQKGFSGALVLVSAVQTPVCHPRRGQHPHGEGGAGSSPGGQGHRGGQGPPRGQRPHWETRSLLGAASLPGTGSWEGEVSSLGSESSRAAFPRRVSTGTDIPRPLSVLSPL